MKMRMRAVGVPKPVMRDMMSVDMMTMAKASTMGPTMSPSVEASGSPAMPRARLGIRDAPYKQQQDEQEYLDVFTHKPSPFISKIVI